MTKWDHLIEGKALKPTQQMIKLADTITATIKSTVEKHVNKGRVSIRSITAALNSEKSITDVVVDGGKYGKQRVQLTYKLSPLAGLFAAGAAPVGWEELIAKDTNIPEFLRSTQADQAKLSRDHTLDDKYDHTIVVTLGGDQLLKLKLPIVHRLLKRKVMKSYSKDLNHLHALLVHEFVHTIDPKSQVAFIKKQQEFRTRKGGYPSGNALLAVGAPEKYIKDPVEQETWTRDAARLLIAHAYKQRNSIADVEKAIRSPKPEMFKNYSNMNLPSMTKGKLLNVLTIYKNKPTLWKKFLRTLVDELPEFKKNPSSYMRKYDIDESPKLVTKLRKNLARGHLIGQTIAKVANFIARQGEKG